MRAPLVVLGMIPVERLCLRRVGVTERPQPLHKLSSSINYPHEKSGFMYNICTHNQRAYLDFARIAQNKFPSLPHFMHILLYLFVDSDYGHKQTYTLISFRFGYLSDF